MVVAFLVNIYFTTEKQKKKKKKARDNSREDVQALLEAEKESRRNCAVKSGFPCLTEHNIIYCFNDAS